MTAQRSIKQQYLDMYKGIPTDYLIMNTYFPDPNSTRCPNILWNGPAFMNACHGPEGGDDCWGVHYITNRASGYGALPEPGKFMLDDITRWPDVIKAPDISGIDWAEEARKGEEFANMIHAGRDTTAQVYQLHSGYFQQLVAFMGFNGALIAMQTEPEEVKGLMEYMCDFNCRVLDASLDLYAPDVMQLIDDTCTWSSPFMSPDQYRDLIKPYVAREAQYALDRNMPIVMHCCGKCETLMDDWRDFGVQMWDPAQTCNDLVGIQKKYGANLMIAGGWDANGRLADPDISEEEFKEITKDMIRSYAAQNVPFLFAGMIACAPDDTVNTTKNRWLTEIVESDFGKSLFK